MSMIIAGVAKAAALAAKVAKVAKVASTVGKVAKAASTVSKISKVAKVANKVKKVANVVGGAKNVVDKLAGPKSTPPPSGSSASDFASMKFNAGSPAKMYSPYKMKGPSLYNSPMKSKTGAKNLLKAVPNQKAYNKLSDENKKGFDKAAKKAGLPTKKSPAKDIKGTYKKVVKTVKKVVKKVKKVANKSTLTNPKSSSEHMSDMGDARMHTSYLKDINNAKTPEARKKAESNLMYKYYSEKSKKNRPNKKDRY